MPLYELLCISAHLREYRHIKELVTTCAMHVMDNGGVVRTLDCWGPRLLPSKMHRHQQWHAIGDYWTMHFDTNPRVLHALNRSLRQDPRVIRWTMTKLGEKIEDIVDLKQQTITRTPVTERMTPKEGANEKSQKTIARTLGIEKTSGKADMVEKSQLNT